MEIAYRLGKKEDSKALSELALGAKAHWPYDEQFIKDCAEDLAISEERAAGGFIVVAIENNKIIGFFGFSSGLNDDPEMTHLFVEPTLIGKGIGIQLWKHALNFAKQNGWISFKLIADPYAAEKFYFKVGCKKIGEIESSVRPGRKLPLLKFEIE
ncbi:MAG TPA: GNAT family N-acetyltransferase [Bdellovibrio sp.]|nr:GNAT family N-acetyltransferase [Bdellovibrio sp.]